MKKVNYSCLAVLVSILVTPALRADDPTPPPVPPPQYTGDFSLGLSLTRGNSDTSNFNLAFHLVDDPKTKNVIKYDAFYLRSSDDTGVTADRLAFGARDEYNFSALDYGFADVHYLRDQFKKIDYLVSPIVGAGHHFIKTSTTDLAGEIGVGAALESDTGQSRTTDGAVQARELYHHKLTATSTFDQTASALWKAQDFGDALYHFDAALASALTKKSQLKVAVLDDFKTRPPDPTVKKNDMSLIAAVVLKF